MIDLDTLQRIFEGDPDLTPLEEALVLGEVPNMIAEIRELRATLANERGEGEGPSEGWFFEYGQAAWRRAADRETHRCCSVWMTEERGQWWFGVSDVGDNEWPDAVEWSDGREQSAREAMRAADRARSAP